MLSACGTFRTRRDVCLESVTHSKTDPDQPGLSRRARVQQVVHVDDADRLAGLDRVRSTAPL